MSRPTTSRYRHVASTPQADSNTQAPDSTAMTLIWVRSREAHFNTGAAVMPRTGRRVSRG